jgi:hypothetical protein
MDIKKLILASLLIPFLLIVGTGMYNMVGMASKVPLTYKCTDNDAFGEDPLAAKGVVIVTTNTGERNIYTDECIDTKTIREYSCDPKTNQQTYSDESCMYDRVCRFSSCVTE